jgi:hypothetical protein
LKCWPSSCAAGYFAIAARDIQTGEELIWNYLEFDLVDVSKNNLWNLIECNCGLVRNDFTSENYYSTQPLMEAVKLNA